MRDVRLLTFYLLIISVQDAHTQSETDRPHRIWIEEAREAYRIPALARNATHGFRIEKGRLDMLLLTTDSVVRTIALPELKIDPKEATLIAGPSDSDLYLLHTTEWSTGAFSPFRREGDSLDGRRVGWQIDTGRRVPGKQVLYRVNVATGAVSVIDTFPFYNSDHYLDPTRTKLLEMDGTDFLDIRELRTGKILSSIGQREMLFRYPGVFIDRIAGCLARVVGAYVTRDERYGITITEDSAKVFDIRDRRVLWTLKARPRPMAVALWINDRDQMTIVYDNDTSITYGIRSGAEHKAYHPGLPSVGLFLTEDTLVGYDRIWDYEDYQATADTLGFYDLKRNQFTPLRAMRKNVERLDGIAAGRALISRRYQPFEYFDLRTRRSDTLNMMGGPIMSLAVSSQSRTILASVSSFGYKLFDEAAHKILADWSCPIEWKTAASNDRLAIAGKDNDSVVIVNLDRRTVERTIDARYYPRNVGFANHQRSIVVPHVGQRNTCAFMYDIRSGAMYDSICPIPFEAEAFYSPDDTHLFVTGTDSILSYDLHTHVPDAIMQCGINPVTGLSFSRNKSWMAATDQARKAYLWDLRDTAIRDWRFIGGSSNQTGFSPNDRYYLTTSDRGLRAIDLGSGSETPDVIAMPNRITAFAFSEDGTMLVVGDEKGSLARYDVPSSWLAPFEITHRPTKCVLPLRFYIPKSARPALQNGKPYSPPRSDVTLELLNAKHEVVDHVITNGVLHAGKWHIWEYDASKLPVGRYYGRAIVGGIETIEQYERK